MAWPSGAVRSLTRWKSTSTLLRPGLEGREAHVHLFLLLPAGGDVLDHRGHARELAALGADEDDVELDGDPRTVLSHGRNRQRVASILRDPARHHLVPAFPVPLPLAHRHDQIERLSDRFLFRVAEHGLGSRVPEADLPLVVREQNCHRVVLDDLPAEPPVVSGLVHVTLLWSLRREGAPSPSLCSERTAPSGGPPRGCANRGCGSPCREVPRKSG